MDLLYHRYADPVSLLNTVVGFGDLDGFLDTMLKQIDEDRLWELYLHQLSMSGALRTGRLPWKRGVPEAAARRRRPR